jgi:serine/threonine protein phosphatase PrpC
MLPLCRSRLYKCASVVVIKSHIAHIFYIGDSHVYRFRPTDLGDDFEQITHDHLVRVSKDSTCLTLIVMTLT